MDRPFLFWIVDRPTGAVLFLVGPENHRSRRAVEKIGGVLSGTRFERGHEAVEYRITRAAWFAG